MPIKISQLSELTSVTDSTVLPVVDTATLTPISKKSTLGTLSAHILAGNAASATKLATPRTINGVNFDGTADIDITTALATASDTINGGVIIPLVGTSGITNDTGTIGLAIATGSQLGGVKIGAGINVAVDGTLTGPVRKFHGFSVDENSNLIYSTTEDSAINLQDTTGADIYEDVDIGTNEYSYSLDSDGNLIVTFS
jgi:hypothetical protein